jgi:hypothetical protein
MGRLLRFFIEAVTAAGTATACPNWRAICGRSGCTSRHRDCINIRSDYSRVGSMIAAADCTKLG